MTRIAVVLAVATALATPARAQTPSELLEKGIYAEETQGDLPAAIKIYEQIFASASAERATVAQALFRLGMCYLKSGRQADAAATFTRLAKEYPEQKALLAQVPATNTLSLRPAPWDGEETLVFHATAQGATGGTVLVWRVQDALLDGRPIHRLESFQAPLMYTSVRVDAETFRPIDSRHEVKMMGRRGETSFSPTGIDVVTWEKGESKRQQIPVTRTVYDNEAVVQLMRRLPLAEGYSVTLPVLSVGGAMILDVKIEVVGRETLTVPAGTFETHKVSLGVYGDGRRLQEQKFWYSADAHQYPVQMESVVSIKLAAVVPGPRAEPMTLNDAEAGVSLTVPSGWLVARAPATPNALHVVMFAPEMKTYGAFHKTPLSRDTPAKTARQMADDHVRWGQDKFKVYATQPDSPAGRDVNGREAWQVIADYTHPLTGAGMIDYRTFIAHNGQGVTFDFGIEKGTWPGLKPTLDQIVGSLVLE